MHFGRYLTAAEFARELGELRAYRGQSVGDDLLEKLEEARLVVPHVRVRLPDPVARRFWLEGHPHKMHGPVEPDGPRWDAAVALSNAIYKWQNPRVYGFWPHPLDAPEPQFHEFIEDPVDRPFQPWLDMRVDVSNDDYPKLFDSHNCDPYYSTWQLLLAAEVADMGAHFRVNLAEPGAIQAIDAAYHEGKRPGHQMRYSFLPVHAMRSFSEHRPTLDAVVWFAEESSRALDHILKDHGGGRFQLSQEQNDRYEADRSQCALASAARYNVDVDQLTALSQFLGEQWAQWNRDGRPRVADAYKAFLGKTVGMLRAVGGLGFNDVRDRIGRQGGWHKPILDVIWPDWAEEEKRRVHLTLKASFAKSTLGPIDDADLDAFVDFLATNGLEAFFWRLRSFEDHALRGNEFAREGMKSDLQGLALAVEHLARVLGGQHLQLNEMFKELWRRDLEVTASLKSKEVTDLGRQKALLNDWPALVKRFDALRAQGRVGSIAADLAMAYRIRGGAHFALPAQGHFEIEGLFVSVMRAAFLTFRMVHFGRS